MQEEDYREPELQPDYQLLMKQLGEAGVTFKRIWDAIVKGVGEAANAIIDVFSNIQRTFCEQQPGRSKLRLYRHRTQHEKRMAWKMKNSPQMREISYKRAMIARRNLSICQS